MFRLFRRNSVSRQDQATMRLNESAERFRQAAECVSGADACLFWDLAEAVERLCRHVTDNPAHLNPLRRLWVYFIPRSSEQALAWAEQARRDPLDAPDRTALRHFRGFLNLLNEADHACRRRSYDRLEVSVQALEAQLQRVRP